MRPEHLEGLRECCLSDADFERMQQILLAVEAERQQTELTTLRQSLSGEQEQQPLLATEPDDYQESLRRLIVEQTMDLINTNKRLRQEISDRRWAEKALQESEQRFRSLIENATDIIVILDEHGIFRYCSPSAERVLGYRLEEILGHAAVEFVHPADSNCIIQALQQAIAHPHVSQTPVEYRVRHRTGSWCLFEAVATALLDDPTINGVVVNCHDITERQQAETALRVANRQIANILESITDAFVSLDLAWRFTYINHRAAQLFQRSREELLGQNPWQVFPELISPGLEAEFRHALDQKEAITFEEFFPPLNRWFEVRVFPATDSLSIFLVDVTEKRQEQAELLEMSTALGNAVEGIARLDISGHYIALNRAYAIALGYQPEELIGRYWEQTVHPDDLPEMQIARQQMLIEGKAELEVRAVRQDGSLFHQEVVMVAAYDWHDRLIGNHCFTRDITERKQAEEILRQQAERERLMAAIAQRIRTSLDLGAILNTTASEVQQFLKAERVIILNIDTDGNGQVTAESVKPGWSSLLGLQQTDVWFKQQHDYYQQGNNLVLDTVEPVMPPLFRNSLLHAQIQALLVVPILHSGQLWGILEVHQCSTVRHWEPVEISLLEQLATQVAIAIQQSELYQQVQKLNAELEQQVQERTAQLQKALQFESMLKRITDSVRDSLDEEQILQTVVQELALGLEIWGCDAALHDVQQHTSTIQYEHINANDLQPAQGQIVRMADYAEIFDQLLNAECVQYCRISPTANDAMPPSSTVLVHPIVDDQEVLGSLWLFKSATETFGSQEIRLVQQVTNQCAIALRQARLYQTAQAQVAVLEELNQLKDDFLSTVSHELRTPMSNMKMAIHMLRSVANPDRQERYLDILQSECSREIELINDLLDLQRLEASSYPVNLEVIDLTEFLHTIVEPFQSRMGDREQILNVDVPAHLPGIVSDRAVLTRILSELLNNACKYTPPTGRLSLSAASQLTTPPSVPQVVVTISNEAEIASSDLSRIFEKFYRIPNADPWKQGGTGLGLALVQRLVTQLTGKIAVTSNNGWTTFTLMLPLDQHALLAGNAE